MTDRKADTNECVSIDRAGQPGNDYSDQPRLSADGRYVTFFSDATNLDPACAAPTDTQAYVRDRTTDVTTCESVDAGGAPADRSVLFPDVSGDGRTISFLTDATNLDPHCPGTGSSQMFVRDLDRGINTCASVGENGRGTSSVFGTGSLSRDGNLVTFMSTGPFIAADGNGVIADMFVRDITFGVTTIASDAPWNPTRTCSRRISRTTGAISCSRPMRRISCRTTRTAAGTSFGGISGPAK